MTVVDKNIVDTYTNLLEGLDSPIKLKLIERLSKSLRNEKDSTDKSFFESFGSFPKKYLLKKSLSMLKPQESFEKKISISDAISARYQYLRILPSG